jgi:hypothetical protein
MYGISLQILHFRTFLDRDLVGNMGRIAGARLNDSGNGLNFTCKRLPADAEGNR